MRFPLAVNFRKTFPEVIDTNLICHIFPTKQIDVQRIIDYALNNAGLEKIVIFGSAVTWNCNADSDLDIAVWSDHNNFKLFSKYLSKNLQTEFDLIDYNSIDNVHIKNDILKKGVVIYDGTDKT
ncbi:MAG: nucleotidyltransferase domain-containing protein [Eubacterium sp.]|nr:nucleotidyltransferase domain-containing protein [Eubacterium sp.]